MGIRRVVTGHDDEGKAVFASDEVVEPITSAIVPGYEFFRLWGSDETCRFPDDGSKPEAMQYFPPVGGFRFGLFTVPPESEAQLGDIDFEAALAEMEEKLPGMAGHMEPDDPGMHTTATVDYEYVVSGRALLELDDGATVEVGPGDTIIQNGTRHRWQNPFEVPCRMVVVLVGAEHDAMSG
jgi:mannose-6-phosphate isomerase-like protein (cupin superfamily)